MGKDAGHVAGKRQIALAMLAGLAALAEGSETPSARQRELIRLVRQDCGACHGMTLAGGLGPALTPEALHGKPGEALVATVLDGRPGTPMPAWRSFMSEAEAGWIVEQLMRGFPR